MSETLAFLNAVADWADRRHVEWQLWRTDAPCPSNHATPIADWRVSVMLKDSEGRFTGTVQASHPRGEETEGAFAARVAKGLDRCCAEARRTRIRDYSRADPCRRSGALARTAGSSL